MSFPISGDAHQSAYFGMQASFFSSKAAELSRFIFEYKRVLQSSWSSASPSGDDILLDLSPVSTWHVTRSHVVLSPRLSVSEEQQQVV